MGTASTKKFIKNVSGALTEEAALTTSAGVGDAHRIPALNASGVLDQSIVNAVTASAGAADSGKVAALDAAGRLAANMMPVGITPETASLVTSENLAAGDFVNIWNNASVATARKADATTAGKEAHGFVLAATTSPAAATVYLEGSNTAVTGKTPGVQYLQTTAGTAGTTVPSLTGNVVQRLGVATSATSINFEPAQPITLA